MLHLMKVYESYTTIAEHIKYHCGTVELQMDFKSVSSHGLSSNKTHNTRNQRYLFKNASTYF